MATPRKPRARVLRPHGVASRAPKSAPRIQRPSQVEAEEAVRTLIRWAGDDPKREGLLGTPDRVVRAYREWFRGYDQEPHAILKRTFEETDGYDEMIVLKDMRFESHCEHHLAPIIGARTSPICRIIAWSGSASWRGCSIAMPSGCRSRRR